MQTELVSRIEKIWSMAEIALEQGTVDYGSDGHSKTARLSGMRFKFIDNMLVRVRGNRLDIAISHQKPQDGVVFFPGTETVFHYLIGDDMTLERGYAELTSLHRLFTAKRAA